MYSWAQCLSTPCRVGGDRRSRWKSGMGEGRSAGQTLVIVSAVPTVISTQVAWREFGPLGLGPDAAGMWLAAAALAAAASALLLGLTRSLRWRAVRIGVSVVVP